ncbi:MAG: peptidoglycan DD-metalloendopeptidase family protein [Bacillota bacterium]
MSTHWNRKKWLAAGSLLVALLAWAIRASCNPAKFAVVVDGARAAVVEAPTLAMARQMVDRACKDVVEARSEGKKELVLLSKVSVESLPADQGGLGDRAGCKTAEALAQALSSCLRVGLSAWVITVDGNPVVALNTKEEAERVVERVRNLLGSGGAPGSLREEVKLTEVHFKQRVEVRQDVVELERLRDEDSAVSILVRGTDRVMVHVVQRGQTLWEIARRHNMTIAQLQAANPQVRPDRLQPGQEISIVTTQPLVTCESRSLVTYEVSIPFSVQVESDQDQWPWQVTVKQRGVPGRKRVTAEVVTENGREVSRRVLEEEILSEPVTQIEVRGTKQIPAMGSGSLAWPVPGNISSRYGYRRSGFHHGVDIACDVGTPVIAADSGVVTFSGRKAYYGEMIMIDHGGGKMVTVYGHLSSRAVSVGQTVQKGQVIGYSGMTGRTTGPHLHFEVRVDGDTVDPMQFYKE